MEPKTTSDFYEAVYQIVRLIPRGRVTSYGAIAAALGAKSSSRLIGYALNNCHTVQPYVPAHRVVNRNGMLTGKHHFGTADAMQQALEAEGIRVVEDRIPDFETLFWNPATEIVQD